MIAAVRIAYHQKIQMMHVRFGMSVVVPEDEGRMHKAIESIASNQALIACLGRVLYSMVDWEEQPRFRKSPDPRGNLPVSFVLGERALILVEVSQVPNRQYSPLEVVQYHHQRDPVVGVP